MFDFPSAEHQNVENFTKQGNYFFKNKSTMLETVNWISLNLIDRYTYIYTFFFGKLTNYFFKGW